jgi:iron complex outermembrane recepter protein
MFIKRLLSGYQSFSIYLILLSLMAPVQLVFSQDEEAIMGIEEVVVTATKRGLVSAQDVALAITAFNSEKLERLDALDFDDFIVHVPGTNFVDNGGPGRGNEVASIRGLSPVGDNTASVVAQYLDGAPRFGSNYRMFDIGEVSVLRGPQGTLWGAQSIGGLISFKSNRPNTEEFDASMQGDIYSSEGDGSLSYRVSGHVNVPVNDKFAVRVAGHYVDESGYIDNVTIGENNINDVDEKAWRISALFTPTDDISLTLVYHGNDLRADAPTFFDLALGDGNVSGISAENPSDQEFDLVNIIADINFDWATLSYNGSYFKQESITSDITANDSFSAFGFPAQTDSRIDQESWTHEIRLASANNGSRFGWIVGYYYDDLDDLSLATESAINFPDPNNPLATANPFIPFEFSRIGGPETFKEWAIFGELTYDITDQIEVLFGGRYFDWSVDNQEEFTFFGNNFQQDTGKVGNDDFFYKVQLSYTPTDDMLLYATRSEGFRFGGFNPFVGLAGITQEFIGFDPDNLTNYEAGFKTSWLENRVFFNASGFFMEWSDVQTVVRAPIGTFAFTANAANLNAWGSEVEFVTQDLIAEGVYLSGSFAFAQNEFTEDAILFPQNPAAALILKGDELRETHRVTWSLDAGYDFTIFNNVESFVRMNYWHKAPTTSEGFNGNDGNIPLPTQDVVNMSAGARLSKWRVKLYVDNVTNARPLLRTFPSATSSSVADRASSLRPRTVGLEVTYLFGAYD